MKPNREHLERMIVLLTDLQQAIDKDPDKWATFDLRMWRNDCGTCFCAVGHAAMDPWFIERGLFMGSDTGPKGTQVLAPAMEYARGWRAVCNFFSLEMASAMYLFSSCQYEHDAAPRDVVARIETLLAELPDHVDRLPPVQH